MYIGISVLMYKHIHIFPFVGYLYKVVNIRVGEILKIQIYHWSYTQ